MVTHTNSKIILQQSDLEAFKLSAKSEVTDNYINKYLNDYKSKGIDNKMELYSHLLEVAIIAKDVVGLDLILAQPFEHKNNILTFVGGDGWSIICNVLNTTSPNILYKIQEYIDLHEHEFNKPSLDANNFLLFENIICNPQVPTTPNSLITDYLKPLYSEESIEKLISFIGKDTIDNYYM